MSNLINPFHFERVPGQYTDGTITTREVATMLGVSVQTINKYCANGDLKFVKVNGRRYFKENEVVDFITLKREREKQKRGDEWKSYRI